MNIYEVSWRSTQQIAIVNAGNELQNNIDGWGAGVFIYFKKKLTFVTADHVPHYDDHAPSNDTGNRLNKDDHIYVITNVTDSSNQLGFQSIGGIYSFDEYHLPDSSEPTEDELELASIPDMKDCAFSFIRKGQVVNIITHDLQDGTNNIILVNAGLNKIIIPEERFNLDIPNDPCIVSGTVMNKIIQLTDGRKQLDRKNVYHQDLMYSGKKNNDGDYIFHTASYDDVLNSLWEGLSGGPVIDICGRLVGILVRAVKENNTVIVKPISEILKYISMADRFEYPDYPSLPR